MEFGTRIWQWYISRVVTIRFKPELQLLASASYQQRNHIYQPEKLISAPIFPFVQEAVFVEERVIGLIPRVVFFTWNWKPIEYGLFLTNRRSIFFVLKDPDRWVSLALGSVMASMLGDERYPDLRQLSPEHVLNLRDSLVIYHDVLQDLRFKPSSEYYKMTVKHKTSEGKSKKIVFAVAPPLEHMKQMRREGHKKKNILAKYAKYVQEMYQKALPSPFVQTVKWATTL